MEYKRFVSVFWGRAWVCKRSCFGRTLRTCYTLYGITPDSLEREIKTILIKTLKPLLIGAFRIERGGFCNFSSFLCISSKIQVANRTVLLSIRTRQNFRSLKWLVQLSISLPETFPKMKSRSMDLTPTLLTTQQVSTPHLRQVCLGQHHIYSAQGIQ